MAVNLKVINKLEKLSSNKWWWRSENTIIIQNEPYQLLLFKSYWNFSTYKFIELDKLTEQQAMLLSLCSLMRAKL